MALNEKAHLDSAPKIYTTPHRSRRLPMARLEPQTLKPEAIRQFEAYLVKFTTAVK